MKLTVFSRNPHTPIIPQSVRLRMERGRVIRAEKPPFVPCSRRSACSACPLQFFGNKKNHMPDARGACRTYDWGFDGGLTPSTACGRGTRSARPRGLGGDFEFLPLKSPRNPITPIETSRVSTLHPGLYKRLREDARRVIGATAKPLYTIGGKAGGLDRRTIR